MEKVVVVRFSEIGLKGKNRKDFERALLLNIKEKTSKEVLWKWGRFYVKMDWEKEDLSVFNEIFGVQNYSPAIFTSHDWEEIQEAARKLCSLESGAKKFKVNAKRVYKDFPMGIYDVNRKLGAFVIKEFGLEVDVHNPDFELGVEIREEGVLLFTRKIRGAGGLPVGVSGKVLLLLSGGIDSPVAGWYAMRRGAVLEAISFVSPPYTGLETEEKIRKVVERLRRFSPRHPIRLHFAPLTPVLELLKEEAPRKLLLVLQRRSMFRIAERLALSVKAKALVTGESVGQVASQTLQNIMVIEDAVKLPVLRPLCGLDKVEIVEKAREIGTYEISIQKGVDVCSMFVPKSPSTAASLEKVREVEESLGERLRGAEDEVYYNIERVMV